MFAFVLFKVCSWINIADIYDYVPINNYDKYYTLRPFIYRTYGFPKVKEKQ